MGHALVIELVITGGQTGADQAGWRAAKAAGIPTGGWMPKGFKTEAGPRPGFAELYGAREHASSSYPARTEANARESDVTVFFGRESPGFYATGQACFRAERPLFHVPGPNPTPFKLPGDFIEWLAGKKVRVLNVAGNRESFNPGIGVWAEAYMRDVFRLMKEGGDR